MNRVLARHPVVWAVAVAGLALAATLWWVRADTDPPGLDTRTARSGDVTVTMTALALGPAGAQFRIVLETHSVELDLDLAAAAQLRLDGQLMGAGAWSGDAPGGHHRSGTLSYATAVPPDTTVELRIAGLPEEVVGVWTAP